MRRAFVATFVLAAVCAACGGRIAPEDPFDDPYVDAPTPPAVPSNRIVQLTMDGASTCVVRGDGTVWCWGWNDRDRLAVGDACGSSCTTPTQVPAFHDVVQLARTSVSECAVLRDGSVACRLRCRLVGHDTVEDCRAATAVGTAVTIDGLAGVAEVRLGGTFDCVRLVDGSVSCAADFERHAFDPKLPGRATSLSVGEGHACAVVEGGDLFCWGHNDDGELGIAAREYTQLAVRVEGVRDVDAVATGVRLTCTHERSGPVSCFGIESWETEGFPGSSGCGACDGPRCRIEPARIDGVLAGPSLDIAGWTMIRGAICGSNAFDHACAVGRDGAPWCWGPFDRDTPLAPHRIDIGGVRLIAAGIGSTCAAKNDGTVWCWGENFYGQLGDGTTTAHSSPVRVALPWAPEP